MTFKKNPKTQKPKQNNPPQKNSKTKKQNKKAPQKQTNRKTPTNQTPKTKQKNFFEFLNLPLEERLLGFELIRMNPCNKMQTPQSI